MKSKVKTEKFKCLICAEKFEISSDRWENFQKESISGKHTDDIEHIKCPKCNDIRVQHLANVEIKRDNIKKISEEISTFFGSFLAELLAPIIYIWNEKNTYILTSFFEFIFFLISIFCLNYFFKIEYFYAVIFIMVYKLLNIIKKRIM